MKQPRAVCLFLLFLLTLTGCIFPVKPGSHIWFYTFGTGPGKDTLTPVSYLELRPDGSFSRILAALPTANGSKKNSSSS